MTVTGNSGQRDLFPTITLSPDPYEDLESIANLYRQKQWTAKDLRQLLLQRVLLALSPKAPEVKIKDRALVGIAIDLSGSMKESIRNETGDRRNRLESIRHSLKRLTKEAKTLFQEDIPGELELTVDLMAYGFGFRDITACDLLSFIKAGKNIVAQFKKEPDKNTLPDDPYGELELQAKEYGLTAWKARDFKRFFVPEDAFKMLRIFDLDREIASELAHRLPNIVPPTKREIATYGLTSATTLDPSFILHAGIKASRAQLVRKEYEDAQQRVETLKRDFDSGELQRNIRGKIINRQLRDVGETTLPLEAVGNLLEENEENWDNIEEYIYDSTPMKETFRQLVDRFRRELTNRPKRRVLFVVSDGESTDGNPLELANILKESLRVVVFSCFITNYDVTNPRVLLNEAEFNKVGSHWSKGARLMFEMASPYQANEPYAKFFEKKKWTVHEPGARLFAQLNHSSLLEEFMEIALLFNNEAETPRGR